MPYAFPRGPVSRPHHPAPWPAIAPRNLPAPRAPPPRGAAPPAPSSAPLAAPRARGSRRPPPAAWRCTLCSRSGRSASRKSRRTGRWGSAPPWLRGSSVARRRQPLALTLLSQQPLGEVQPVGEIAHLLTHLLQLIQQLGAQQRNLVSRALALGTVRDPLGERAHERSQHTVGPPQGAQAENGDQQVLAVHYPGPIRCPSRCLASSRSAKSTRSASSAMSRRTASSSCSSASLWSPSSARTSPCPLPRMRSATARPIGEIERRNSVPPPNRKTIARTPSISMISGAARDAPDLALAPKGAR